MVHFSELSMDEVRSALFIIEMARTKHSPAHNETENKRRMIESILQVSELPRMHNLTAEKIEAVREMIITAIRNPTAINTSTMSIDLARIIEGARTRILKNQRPVPQRQVRKNGGGGGGHPPKNKAHRKMPTEMRRRGTYGRRRPI